MVDIYAGYIVKISRLGMRYPSLKWWTDIHVDELFKRDSPVQWHNSEVEIELLQP